MDSLCLFHNPSFRVLHEIYNILDLLTHRNLIDDLLYSILNAKITLINQTVCISDVTKDSFRCIVMLRKNYGVYTVICYRIS